MKGSLPVEIERWRTSRGRLVRRREAAPIPGPGEVVLEVEGCVLDATCVRMLAADEVCPGGAVAGRVVAASDELENLVGCRVLSSAVLPCGECPICQRGRGPACARAVRVGESWPGGLATHLLAPAGFLVRADGPSAPPASFPPWQLAALPGPIGRVYHALARAGLGPGELVVFIGDTAEARFGEQIASARAARASMTGVADATPERLRDLVGQAAARVVRIVETTGRAVAVARALELASPTGTVSLLGWNDDEPVVLPRPAIQETPLLVTDAPHPDLLVEILALLARGELEVAPHVARIVPSDLEDAVARLLQGRSPPCPIFTPAT